MTTKDAKEYMNRLEIPQLFEVRFLQKYVWIFVSRADLKYLRYTYAFVLCKHEL